MRGRGGPGRIGLRRGMRQRGGPTGRGAFGGRGAARGAAGGRGMMYNISRFLLNCLKFKS